MRYLTLALAASVFMLAAASCATTGGADYAQPAAGGADVFAGKNWNAPLRNNMYDRWEFSGGGTFHFRHVHHGEPLDRGVYRYTLADGIISVTKEGSGESAAYTYTFSGETVTLTPVKHGGAEHGTPAVHTEPAAEHAGPAEHNPPGGHQMGALPEAPVTFTRAP